MSLGPVMLDLQGLELSQEETELLCHPQVGGVILFRRNYESPEQLQQLLARVHVLRQPRLLVAVDQEGGRVQRFRDGFTRLPPAARFGPIYDEDRKRALRLAESCGWLMASELRAVGVDISLAPVLDLAWGRSEVIGDRAFHREPAAVADLAHAYIEGMRRAGMAATGKHFPGHGWVTADSHTAVPEDPRHLEDLWFSDLVPFERLVHAGLAAVMPAHVIYPRVDTQPPGFSAYWLQQVLRQRLGFQGVVFSDDLSMEGARVAGDLPERARAALQAGCDMVLVCNNRAGAVRVLDALAGYADPVAQSRLVRLHGRHGQSWSALHQDRIWQQTAQAILGLDPPRSLDLV